MRTGLKNYETGVFKPKESLSEDINREALEYAFEQGAKSRAEAINLLKQEENL